MADPKLIATLSSLLGPLPGVKEKQLLFRTHTKRNRHFDRSPALIARA
jgi:hypothetical protein